MNENNLREENYSGPIKVGMKLNTTDGVGIVEEIRPGIFPFLVKLENGGYAWQSEIHIISIISLN